VTMLRANKFSREAAAVLMFGSSLLAIAAPAQAQTAAAPRPAAPVVTAPAVTAPAADQFIKSINVVGSQRIEPDTVRSYVKLRAGGKYTTETLDDALRDLIETELFADVQIRDNSGDLIIEVRENPVINRILLEKKRSGQRSSWHRARSSHVPKRGLMSPGLSSFISARAATAQASSQRW
jgi:outer membrane protein insertion porin family